MIMRRYGMTARSVACGISLGLVVVASGLGAEEPKSAPAFSGKAAAAIQQLESDDAYQRQLGFLRLEALRETATLDVIRQYLESPDEEIRAYSLRAVAAIEGVASVPLLLETLKTDKHPRVRRAALLGVEPFGASDPDVLPACLVALRDREAEVRITAVDIVSRMDDPRARDAIHARFKREHDPNVRHALKLARRRLGEL